MKIDATAQFWRIKKLSVRASNCLAKANIANEQELIEKFTTLDSLIALRNCGKFSTGNAKWCRLLNAVLYKDRFFSILKVAFNKDIILRHGQHSLYYGPGSRIYVMESLP